MYVTCRTWRWQCFWSIRLLFSALQQHQLMTDAPLSWPDFRFRSYSHSKSKAVQRLYTAPTLAQIHSLEKLPIRFSSWAHLTATCGISDMSPCSGALACVHKNSNLVNETWQDNAMHWQSTVPFSLLCHCKTVMPCSCAPYQIVGH